MIRIAGVCVILLALYFAAWCVCDWMRERVA